MNVVNAAIRAGLVLAYEANSLPGGHGRTVSYLYRGVPGVWSVDDAGSGWCEGAVKPAWLAAAMTFEPSASA